MMPAQTASEGNIEQQQAALPWMSSTKVRLLIIFVLLFY